MLFVLIISRLFKRGKLWLYVPIKTLKRWISFERKKINTVKLPFLKTLIFTFTPPLEQCAFPENH